MLCARTHKELLNWKNKHLNNWLFALMIMYITSAPSMFGYYSFLLCTRRKDVVLAWRHASLLWRENGYVSWRWKEEKLIQPDVADDCTHGAHARHAVRVREGRRAPRERKADAFWGSVRVVPWQQLIIPLELLTCEANTSRDARTRAAPNDKSRVRFSSKHNKQTLQLSNICATGALTRRRS